MRPANRPAKPAASDRSAAFATSRSSTDRYAQVGGSARPPHAGGRRQSDYRISASRTPAASSSHGACAVFRPNYVASAQDTARDVLAQAEPSPSRVTSQKYQSVRRGDSSGALLLRLGHSCDTILARRGKAPRNAPTSPKGAHLWRKRARPASPDAPPSAIRPCYGHRSKPHARWAIALPAVVISKGPTNGALRAGRLQSDEHRLRAVTALWERCRCVASAI